MGYLWFLVKVLIFVLNIFANVSANTETSKCDECIRKGGSWCSEKVPNHCAFETTDVWCSGEPEELIKIDFVTKNGVVLRPSYVERTVFVGNPDSLPFAYISSVQRKVSLEIYNTTQNLNNIIDLEVEDITCVGNQCDFTIEAKVQPQFCKSVGTDMEFIFVKIKVENMTEEAIIKYHVPCACECTKKKEWKSARCNGHGDWACGICDCYEGWSGEDCSSKCFPKRGDTPCANPLMNNLECSGNGKCSNCDTCICYNDREGSQYFDPKNYCSDICMDTNGCDHCLTHNTIGECAGPSDSYSECNHAMTILAYNETIAAERDDYDRKIWATCKDTFIFSKNQKCYVEYVAMRMEDGHINVMIVKSCNDHHSGAIAGTTDTKVPWILGVVGVVAAVAAVAGVMLWKHLNSVPPMPFSSPDYQNIDAEDCVGENPLYKSPTTTFTNPQFGKC